MEATSVTSKGQVTIPQKLRQQLGIRQGSRIEFLLVGDHVEMRVASSPTGLPDSGFGMLKSRHSSGSCAATTEPAAHHPTTR